MPPKRLIAIVNITSTFNFYSKLIGLLPLIILIVLQGCSIDPKQKEKRTEEELRVSNMIAMGDSCIAEWERLALVDSVIRDDTSSLSGFYVNRRINRKDINFTCDMAEFITGNAVFDKQLNIELNKLSNQFEASWRKEFEEAMQSEETKEERKRIRDIFLFEMIIKPVFIKHNAVSVEIEYGHASGGAHGDVGVFYKNYLWIENKLKEINSEDFIDSRIQPDTIYYDPLHRQIFTESNQTFCQGDFSRQVYGDPFPSLVQFISPEDSHCGIIPIRKVNFIFHTRGIKIKFATDWYTGNFRDNLPEHFQDELIPQNEFAKIAAPAILKLWAE